VPWISPPAGGWSSCPSRREGNAWPLKDEAHYDAAVSFLKTVAVRDEDTLDKGQKAYLDALTHFVGDYEQQHHRIEARRKAPLDALKYLMGANGMKPIDLGKLLGNRSTASKILNGKRALSKTHIAILSERFRVDAGLFFEARPLKKTG
jgi:HTH-type transcriptional regulator/antitoxin HigA